MPRIHFSKIKTERIEKYKRSWHLFYKGVVVVHTLIVVYFVWVFIAILLGYMKTPFFRFVNATSVFIIGLILLVNRFRCPLTQLQNQLAEKLEKKKVDGSFIRYLLEKTKVRVGETATNISMVTLGVVIFVLSVI